MKQTEEQYANELIEKYNKIFCDNYKNQDEIIECAKQDVEDTIEAFENNHWKIAIDHYMFYQNVLQILKDKL